MASPSYPFSNFSDWFRGGHVTQAKPMRAKEFFLEMLKKRTSLSAKVVLRPAVRLHL